MENVGKIGKNSDGNVSLFFIFLQMDYSILYLDFSCLAKS